MNTIAFASREILERIFLHTTFLNDLLDNNKSTVYHSGVFVSKMEKRAREVDDSLQGRTAITQVCTNWRNVGLKYRYEFLKIDAKSSDIWVHVNKTLKKHAGGRYVRRLELDAFDSSFARVRAAAGILEQCCNAKYVSVTFADNSRRSVRSYNLLAPSILKLDTSSLIYLSCDFGKSFAQTLLFEKSPDFSSLRSISLHSAFGQDASTLYDTVPLNLAHLQSLSVTSSNGGLLPFLSRSLLPSVRDVTICQLLCPKSYSLFFKAHGYKLRTLTLLDITKDSKVQVLLNSCPYLEELILSLDGLPYRPGEGENTFPIVHSTIKRIGIRDISINSLTVWRTMEALNTLMLKFACTGLFPKVREIRLLDFHKALWANVPWLPRHAQIWMGWIEKCEALMIELQAADGEALSIPSNGPIRLLDVKDEDVLLLENGIKFSTLLKF